MLNDWGADLNVLVGLCVGHDSDFHPPQQGAGSDVHRQGPGTGPQSGSGDLHLKILLQTGSERNNVPGTENAFQAEKLTGRRSGENGRRAEDPAGRHAAAVRRTGVLNVFKLFP